MQGQFSMHRYVYLVACLALVERLCIWSLTRFGSGYIHTVKSLLSGLLLSGHPLFSSHEIPRICSSYLLLKLDLF